MYLRTGQRGWFDLAGAWARYHMDLQAWRTDRWRWKDGGIWFPTGGPQGNRPMRDGWNFAFGPPWGQRKGNPDCMDLQRQSQSKSCYCHFYGSGLADYYCLTGDPDALAAAIDNVEQKDDEFRHFKQFQPGRSSIGSIRGFGRGFEVMMRVLEADPGNEFIEDLCHLCARTLWCILETSRLFFHAAHPPRDGRAPEAVTDLQARLVGDGEAELSFAAPADAGGGRVVRYQAKASTLPIVAYDQWDFARADNARRNWWRAVNLQGEPVPGAPRTRERLVVTGVPAGQRIYVAIRSYDADGNRSAIGTAACADR